MLSLHSLFSITRARSLVRCKSDQLTLKWLPTRLREPKLLTLAHRFLHSLISAVCDHFSNLTAPLAFSKTPSTYLSEIHFVSCPSCHFIQVFAQMSFLRESLTNCPHQNSTLGTVRPLAIPIITRYLHLLFVSPLESKLSEGGDLVFFTTLLLVALMQQEFSKYCNHQESHGVFLHRETLKNLTRLSR